jgi:hypothetical protein
MLAEALAALASAGGTALVSAMVTDGWEGVKHRVARLLGRGDPKATSDVLARLDESRAQVAGRSGADLEQAHAEQAVVWQAWLGDLLESHPEAEGGLRALLAEVQAQLIGSAGRVEQYVAGFGQSQQAVQGHGVQNVNFGSQGGSGARR